MSIVKGLNKAAETVHAANVKKGFYDEPSDFGTRIMLIVCELAEAVEADRDGKRCEQAELELAAEANGLGEETFPEIFRDMVKDTVEDEIADSFIRLLDLCGQLQIDIDKHINTKFAFNATREHKHGKKY